MTITHERYEQMQRCRKRCRPQPAFHTVFRERNDIETILYMEIVRHPDMCYEIDELVAARQKHVLAVIDFAPVDFKRRRAPTE